MIISLDIETYGAFKFFENKGVACPDQTVFHPELSRKVDLGTCLPCRLVPQCAVTIVTGEPSDPTGWQPGETAVIDMCGPDVAVLEDLLLKADTIVGSNIVFDIMYLRQFKNIDRILNDAPKPTLVDTVILSWIHSGVRKERSLKALGPALGAFTYDRTLKSGKFAFPMCADAIKYNAQDTHNAVLAARALCQRIADERGQKLSPSAIMFHSERLWNIENLSLTGQAFNRDWLIQHMEDNSELHDQHEDFLARSGILMSGDGSATSQARLIDDAVTEANRIFYNLHDTGLLEYTDKRRGVRNNKENRNILSAIIRHDHPHSPLFMSLQAINACSFYESTTQECNKILADKINRGQDTSVNSGCVTIGNNRHCYPSWYGAPTEDGGVQSARLSCRRPAAQTWNKELRRIMVPTRGRLYHLDMTAFELRIAAALSRDRKMTDFAFAEDPYSSLGHNRTTAKTALLVGVNGGGESKAWRTAIAVNAELITLNEVRELPVFTEWTDYRNTRDIWFQQGKLGKLSLREAEILYSHNANKTIHDTTSFMVQGHAAVFMSLLQSEILNISNHQVDFNLQLHDELVFQTDADKDEVIREFNRAIYDVSNLLFGTDYPFTYKLQPPTIDMSEAGVHDPH